MTKRRKQLVLQDLCARLLYGVYVRINEIHCLDKNEAITEGFVGGYCKPNMCQDYSLDEIYEFLDNNDEVKLYLRPMSGMTKEERREYNKLIAKCIYDPEAYFFDNYDRLYNWLLSHHLDFRGLIPLGLVLEAPDGMYKTE